MGLVDKVMTAVESGYGVGHELRYDLRNLEDEHTAMQEMLASVGLLLGHAGDYDIYELPKIIGDLVHGQQSAYYVDKGYEQLASVLADAIDQAASGKGSKRHAKDGEPFEQQKICEITRRVGLGYPLGPAVKKAQESLRLGKRGPAELLGAINYLAAAVIVMEEEQATAKEDNMVQGGRIPSCNLVFTGYHPGFNG